MKHALLISAIFVTGLSCSILSTDFKINEATTFCSADADCASLPHRTCDVGANLCRTCEPGFSDCNGEVADGCEVKLATDAAHCGACGTPCELAQATATCEAAACKVGQCADGYADCDGDALNGCEVKLATDAAHCGECGNACGSGKFCQVGACIPVPEGMVSIPAGTFTMGDADNTEKAGMVTVSAFFMDVTEVTTEAYAACVASNKCTAAYTNGSCNAGVAGRENHPINCVNWNQATAYCSAQGRRLPTEEEWEYAARGTDGRIYPWGNTTPTNQLCWDGAGNDLGAGNRKSTCAVASFPAGNSPFGLSDMSGNVWEWTSSASGAARVNRGGSWNYGNPSLVRSAYRSRYNPLFQFDYLGFRCAGPFFP